MYASVLEPGPSTQNGGMPPPPSASGVGPLESPLAAKAVCLQVNIRALGCQRRIDPHTVEIAKRGLDAEVPIRTEADHSRLGVAKLILQCPEVAALARQEGEIRRYLKRKTLPSLVFRRGVTLCPLASLDAVEVDLARFRGERRELVDALVAVLPERIAEDREALKDLFAERDYPTAARLQARYEITWQYLAATVPGTLAAFRREIFERERDKAAELWERERGFIQQVLRSELQGLLDHLMERLEPGPTGERRVLRGSRLTDLLSWCEEFAPRNIADDGQLRETVERVRRLVSGVDLERLKSSDAERNVVRGSLNVIRQRLAGEIASLERCYDFDE